MSSWDLVLPPAPVYCDGCGCATVGQVRTERVSTPLGNRTLKTCDDTICVLQARSICDGKPVKVRETAQDKVNARAREGR